MEKENKMFMGVQPVMRVGILLDTDPDTKRRTVCMGLKSEDLSEDLDGFSFDDSRSAIHVGWTMLKYGIEAFVKNKINRIKEY